MFARTEAPYVDLAVLEDSSDTELIQLMKLGNEDVLGVLLRRHRDALYRFCLHLMADRDDAEDVCQESMTRAILRVDSLQTGAAFRSWLFSIARNLSIDSHRSRKRTCPLPDEEIVPLPLPLREDSPYERIEIEEEHQTVAQALNRLKKNHQTVLMMREVEGLSYAEIAERLDVSQSAVETLLFRARRRLREEYGKSASPAPAFALMPFLRGLLGRLATPLSGAPLVAKVAVTAVVIGGAVITTPHVIPALAGDHSRRAGTTSLVARTVRSVANGPATIPVSTPGLAATIAKRRPPTSDKQQPIGAAAHGSPRRPSYRARQTRSALRQHPISGDSATTVPTVAPLRRTPGGAVVIRGPGIHSGSIHSGRGSVHLVSPNHSGSPTPQAVVPTRAGVAAPHPRMGTPSPGGSTPMPTRVGATAVPTPLPLPGSSAVPGGTQVALPVTQAPTAVVGQVEGTATQVVGQVKQSATQVVGQVKQQATQVVGQVTQVATQVIGQVKQQPTQVTGQIKQQATRVPSGLPKPPVPAPTIPVHLP